MYQKSVVLTMTLVLDLGDSFQLATVVKLIVV